MAPMTEKQLEFFTEQTERAVRMATNRVIKRATVGFLILLFGLGGQYYVGQADLSKRRDIAQKQRGAIVRTGNSVAVSGCNRDFISAKALRGLLISALTQTKAAYKRGDIPLEQYRRAQAFYGEQLSILALPDCRPVAHLVSADPTKPIIIPAPLYEKSK